MTDQRIEELREMFMGSLKVYSDAPYSSNEREPFVYWMVYKFHCLLLQKEITEEEFGILVDFTMCW